MNGNCIISRILKTELIKWHDLAFLQSDEFKDFSPEEEVKLRQSVITNDFTDPFKVWHDLPTNTVYCLDGKHRTIILNKLLQEGINVPELLPATFIDCTDIQEAAKLVLQYSSQYARTTQAGLLDFMDTYDLDLDKIRLEINIPDINFENIFGDLDKDFSAHNEEMSADEFADEIILKFAYCREDYIKVKQRLTELMGVHNISKPEDLLKILLQLQ